MYIPHIITPNSVTIIIDQPKSIDKSHPNFSTVVDLLTRNAVNDVASFFELMEPMREYNKAVAASQFTMNNEGCVFLDIEGFPFQLAPELANEVLRIYRSAGDLTALEAFVRKLAQNPDKEVHAQLYSFIQVCGLALTSTGDFLAYKNVKDNFFDIYTGTMDNSPGKWVEMPRFAVEKNPHRTCSAGLHFAAWGYLSHYGYGQKTVIVRINPADVVSIPSDYNNMKGRAYRYFIVKEVEQPEELKNHPVFLFEEDTEVDDEDYCCDTDEDVNEDDLLDAVSEDVLNSLRNLGYSDDAIRNMAKHVIFIPL
ncbi:MAG: hypothetical protein FNT15_05550 [Sulfurovum sp.]|nr:MAG: hypothetical protein FNT15_05550 [Sulfurovum sp.]